MRTNRALVYLLSSPLSSSMHYSPSCESYFRLQHMSECIFFTTFHPNMLFIHTHIDTTKQEILARDQDGLNANYSFLLLDQVMQEV